MIEETVSLFKRTYGYQERMMATGDFFAIGQDTFHQACAIGITEACAFLVLARGSGGDNITSSWSSTAIAKRVGVRWSTAKMAIANLNARKLVKIQGTKDRPVYKIIRKGDDIWLPNSIVDGVSGNPPPVELIRQSQESLLLRLLVDFYHEQNLREDDGISPALVYVNYERERLGEHSQFVVWGFEAGSTHVYRGPASGPHYRAPSEEDVAEGRTANADDFFSRLRILVRLGFIEIVPMLYESKTGEPIHAIYEASSIDLEARLGVACRLACERALSASHVEILDKRGWPDVVVCVPAHIDKVIVRGTYRLTFRPRTSMTGSWWAKLAEKAPRYIADYERIAS